MTSVKIDAAKQVSVPEEETCLMVDADDWARIRQNVGRLGDPIVDWAGLWASIAVGAALALVAVAVSIQTTKQDPHQELLTAVKVSIAFCIVFAFAFGAVGLRERRQQSITSQGVCEDMDGVARRLGHPGLGASPKVPRIGLKGQVSRFWQGDPTPPLAPDSAHTLDPPHT